MTPYHLLAKVFICHELILSSSILAETGEKFTVAGGCHAQSQVWIPPLVTRDQNLFLSKLYFISLVLFCLNCIELQKKNSFSWLLAIQTLVLARTVQWIIWSFVPIWSGEKRICLNSQCAVYIPASSWVRMWSKTINFISYTYH